MKVNWTEPALEDLEAIQVYIAKDSKFYARQFIERIFDAAKKLETFPEIGRRVPEAEERTDVRELIFQGYRIIYFIQPQSIYMANHYRRAATSKFSTDVPATVQRRRCGMDINATPVEPNHSIDQYCPSIKFVAVQVDLR